MTEKKSSDDDEKIKEPETLTLWRRVGAARDTLRAQLRSWEALRGRQRAQWLPLDEYPPERRDAVHEARAQSERYIEAEIAAATNRIAALDRRIRIGTRTEAADRGLSLDQLRELASEAMGASRKATREAVAAWLADRDSAQLREIAGAMLEAMHGAPVDLDALEAEDRADREAAESRLSGSRAERARRIVAKV
jgi:hypothetical protein